MRKLSSNCCPSSVDRCHGMTEEAESCMLESQCVDIMYTKLRGLQRLGRCCRSELKTAMCTTDMLLLLVYAILLLDICLVNYPGGVAFPGARGHFNYANLFFAKCFSLANSQKFDSRINNRLYGT